MASDPFDYSYPSPLAPYHAADALSDNARPAAALPDALAEDGKSYVNPPRADGRVSESYERFVEPLDNGVRGAL